MPNQETGAESWILHIKLNALAGFYGKIASKSPLCSFMRGGWLRELVLGLLEALTAIEPGI